MEVRVTDAWREAFPEAHAGVLLLRNVRNDASSEALQDEVRRLEEHVRNKHRGKTRADLAAGPTMRAYQEHYRAFGQTYHLLGQLESVALKGRPLASPGGPLVTAMFAAEIDRLLLTAGHDAEVVEPPLALDASREGDAFVSISGREQPLRPDDMVMRDRAGIISAVLAGPDERTRVRATTTHVLYVTYAPRGISADAVRGQLQHIARLVRLASATASEVLLEIYPGV